MTTRNTYATLSEYKAYFVGRGGEVQPDIQDDGVIEQLLESASRYLDAKMGRWFYPRIETRSYDVPEDNRLWFDADLLEVTTLTNGDDTTIASTQYNLLPKNVSPKYALEIKDVSSVTWEDDSSGDTEFVIDVLGVWGFHDRYSQDAWKAVTTTAEALDTSELGIDMTSDRYFEPGRIFKIDSEIFHVESKTGNTVTVVKRGDNGSTAATHLTAATVSIWQPMEDARNACIEIANTAYHRRFGQSVQAKEQVTAAGIVLTPREIPVMAEHFIEVYKRFV